MIIGIGNNEVKITCSIRFSLCFVNPCCYERDISVYKHPLGVKDELIRFFKLNVKGQGHSDLTHFTSVISGKPRENVGGKNLESI